MTATLEPRPLPPPTSGPGGCTAGWADDPCPGESEPGCDVDGYPACRWHFEECCSYGCDTDKEV